MKTCKREGCDNGVSSRATWCGDACRMSATRTKQPEHINPNTEPEQDGLTTAKIVAIRETAPPIPELLLVGGMEIQDGYRHYLENPSKYVTRAHPEDLNWGEPMIAGELADSQFAANREAIPGDFDYVGVAV